MTAMNDLDLINAELLGDGTPRNAFSKAAKPGDSLTGEIVEVTRRHRTDETGKPLYWHENRPATTPTTGRPVIDSSLIIQIDCPEDENDEGLRTLRLDRDVQKALREALRTADAQLAIGGRIENFTFVGPLKTGTGRHYCGGTYVPPAA
ncbi:hypothetical protein JK358_34340 [Nocardia sp. 2]|uniref:Uncharacterized protein n=1 Tax=Nocardia acididurans TaxID=2802282 RepID=A0ABS1MFR0_9NOCA|nr:hypothetical protein [Nocardia acididurans]MBL1079498.1 hypothetical protein [Nocardia acididurans]